VDKNLKIRNILINSRKILYFLCGKVCGKLFFKILIIYFIYVIVKSNKSTNLRGEITKIKLLDKMWKNIKFLFITKINEKGEKNRWML